MVQTQWSRRAALAAGMSGAALAGARLSFAQQPTPTGDVDPTSLFLDNAEPRPETLIGTRALNDWPLWWNEKERPSASWEDHTNSVDFRHLSEGLSSKEFVLDAALFRKTLASSFIDEAGLGERVLFGLRACTLVNGSDFQDTSEFKPALRLTESTPDHFNTRCVVGVWDRTTGHFWASQGSTVCNVAYLFGQAKAKAKDTLCNLLPAGVYRYKIGTHRNGTNSRIPGAFILDSNVAIVRNYDESPLSFSSSDNWQFRGPDVADNIHAAYSFREGMPHFSSAGCQTIPGTIIDGKRHEGAWRYFRIAAGLKPDPVITVSKTNSKWVSTSEDSDAAGPDATKTRLSYVLLPARELRLNAETSGSAPDLVRLRRGSQGAAVRKLQAALGQAQDGDFGFRTQQSIINLQALGGWSDGVLTRQRLSELGLPDVFAT